VRSRRLTGGFTLLEVAVVMVIIAIVAVLSIPVYGKIRARAQRVKCSVNLRNLSAATNLYIQEHGQWPQIPPPPVDEPTEEFAETWITALAPFGPTRQTWICPTIQNMLQNPDYATPETARIDYIATPFDDKPTSPREWPRQPWFVEAGDVHGNGNLIIFTDGSISDLKTVVKESGGQ
jgi:prepilin-type N-terminal cleavage/methylation domain-containing protein